MSVVHFLNVREGDCIWINHSSGNNTVIDVSNAQSIIEKYSEMTTFGNYNQKNYPVNPIEYLSSHGVKTIFRFILTHPDMDHMDGIKDLFNNFDVVNFWDTENTKVMDDNTNWGKYNEEDWKFYQEVRKSTMSPKVLHLYAEDQGRYFNQDENGDLGGDCLYILAPTNELVDEANETKDYNDCSYVILYRTYDNKKIIFAGDSAEKTWDYILEKYSEEVTDVDVLVAPHHGRKTGGNDDYLDVLNPKLTLFGNAKSEYLDYASWNNRGLDHITNNQANCIILNIEAKKGIEVYVTNETFARKRNASTYFSNEFEGWYIMTI
jgi:beta-lactamase superfamily II metal-dependent hydrolase